MPTVATTLLLGIHAYTHASRAAERMAATVPSRDGTSSASLELVAACTVAAICPYPHQMNIQPMLFQAWNQFVNTFEKIHTLNTMDVK